MTDTELAMRMLAKELWKKGLEDTSKCCERVASRLAEEADKLDPPPAPEPEIPIGPGDRGQYGGWPDAIVQHWGGSGFITVSFPDVWCSPVGACFERAITSADKFRRTKIAEIKSGDPVEVVAGPYAGKWGRVEDVDKLTQSCRLDLALFQARVPRHEIRKLRA